MTCILCTVQTGERKEPEKPRGFCSLYSCCFLPSHLKPSCPAHRLCVLSSLYQTLSKGGQGSISGPQQHVAVPRPEESLQKGKAGFTFLARKLRTDPEPKDNIWS